MMVSNEEQFSDMSQKELEFWSHRLSLTPQQMLQLDDRQLEIYLRNAMEREDAEYDNFDDLDLESIFLKMAPQTSARIKAGGIEEISEEVWNILWNAAIKVDEMYGGPPDKTNRTVRKLCN